MFGNSSTKPPYDYATQNWYNANRSPSTIHVKNTELRAYFFKYLMQKAISVFRWVIPDSWDKDYFLYTLYGLGYIAVTNTPKYGVICQGGALGGYNLYYRPDYIIISNPLLKGTLKRKIDDDCTLIKLMPDYSGILDKVGYYADMMALCAESVAGNIVNTKFATVFGAKDATQANAYKKMFDKIATGEPAVVIGKQLLDDQGKPSWFPFTQHVKESYIVSDMLADMRKIESMFDTDFGIPSANTDKRERLISDEVNANNVETLTTCELWMETLQKGIDHTNEKYNLDISVAWRNNPQGKGDNENGAADDNVGTDVV